MQMYECMYVYSTTQTLLVIHVNEYFFCGYCFINNAIPEQPKQDKLTCASFLLCTLYNTQRKETMHLS